MIITSDATSAISGLESLISTLERLKKISAAGAGLNSVSNALTKLNTAIATINVDASKITAISDALAPLASIQKATGLASAINALRKLPEISKQLAQTDMGVFATQIQSVATSMKPLADEMQKVSNGFSAFPARIQKIIQSNAGLSASNITTGKSFGIMSLNIGTGVVKLTMLYYSLTRIARVIADWITDSNAYVENLNLFTVAMGKYASSAQAYAEKVQAVMGINASTWMREQGIFMTLLTGFGNTTAASATMSKNLVQLGYDISSFFNISVADAMQKLQSAVAGELEPVRRLGYDLSQARMQMDAQAIAVADSFENIDFSDSRLQAAADAAGIKILVSTLTQSEKSLLRYIELMTQVTTVQGDMARTLESPANQIRILKANFELLSIQLGNIFIPLLNRILPTAIAITMVLRGLAAEVAALFGYTLPEFDYSQVKAMGSATDDIASGFDDSTEAAKKLKNAVAGFDELNILSTSDSSTAGAEATSTFAEALKNITLPEYDFLGGLTKSKASEIAEAMYEPFKKVVLVIMAIGVALSTIQFVNNLLKFGEAASKFGEVMSSIGLSIKGFMLKLLPLFNPVTLGILAVGAVIVAAFINAYNTSDVFREKVNALGTWISQTFKAVWDNLKVAVDAVGSAFMSLWTTVLVPLWNGLVSGLTPVFIALVDVLTFLWTGVISPLAIGISGVFAESWAGVFKLIQDNVIPILAGLIVILGSLWNDFLIPIATVLWTVLEPAFRLVFGAIGTIIETFFTVLRGITEFLTGVFTGDWKTAWSGIETIFTGVWNGLRSLIEGVMTGISNVIKGVVDAWNAMIKLVTTPFNVNGPEITMTAGYSPTQVAATGGVIEDGLFTMNHGEMAGQFNNGQTIVANNQQIVQGISEGVYSAVVAAMGQGSGDKDNTFNVYISGKQVTAAVEKVQKERGMNLVGNQLGVW